MTETEKIDDYDSLIINLIEKRFQFEQSRNDSFRERASSLIQINLVYMGIITAIITFRIQAKIPLTSLFENSVHLAIIFPTISIVLGLLVLVPLQQKIIDVSKFDKQYKDSELSHQVGAYIQTSLDFINSNTTKSNLLFALLITSIATFMAGLFGIIFIALSLT